MEYSGGCGDFPVSDDQPGNVQRMEKTKHKHGVWAGARTLIRDEEFPSLLEASKLRLGSLEPNRDQTKFQYAWRKWKGDLQALCDRPNLPPSCAEMVKVLHYNFSYNMEEMLEIALQIARAVIELELRRSEQARGVHSPCSDSDTGKETALMTRVRSAMKHKEQDVKKCIELFIQRCYPKVVPTTPQPLQQSGPPHAPEPVHTPDESVSAHMQAPANFDFFFELPFQPEWEAPNNSPTGLQFTPPSHVTLPTECLDANERETSYEVACGEHVPGLTFNPIVLQGNSDPLFSVMVLCKQGEVPQAVQCYKAAIQCDIQRHTNDMAKAAGLTPWYYMWLKLGEEVKSREDFAEKRGRPPFPPTSQILCELDPVFAELECDRDYGEFGHAAEATLDSAIEVGNFAAKATKGLLMLGAEADVGGPLGFGNQYGEDTEAREKAGLQLVLDAMRTDQWTVPRFAVQLIKDRHISTSLGTVHAVVESIRERAESCSVTSFHLGDLLGYEMAGQVGYSCNVTEAKKAFQSCLDGVYVTSDIRLQCTRKLGRLLTFGVSGIGVDLGKAEKVLKKGVEAKDTVCIQYLANVRLRQRQPEAASKLFQQLFDMDEWEVYVSAKPDYSKPEWQTYRIHVLEQFKSHFLSDVLNGACLPDTMQQECISREYGELMLIEFHEHGI